MRIRNLSFPAMLFMAMSLSSCMEETHVFHSGDEVPFVVYSEGAGTKASYSDGEGETSGGVLVTERIDWRKGDLVRIYCESSSAPESKYSDYEVIEDGTSSGSSSQSSIGTRGESLCWGDAGVKHVFYGVFPAPGVGSTTTSILKNNVKATLPATQAIAGNIKALDNGDLVANPDLRNLLMTAKSGEYEVDSEVQVSNVNLTFTALTTAIKFIVTNGTGAELDLKSVSLVSGAGKPSAPVLNGDYSVDIDTELDSGRTGELAPVTIGDATFAYNSGRAYPAVTGKAQSTDIKDRTVTINLSDKTGKPLALADGKSLTFTFFLVPTHHLDDLTFSFVKLGSDGKESKLATRLSYTDGTGVFFPRFKKSTVAGLLLPSSAQWTVTYAPSIVSWEQGEGTLPVYSLEAGFVTTVNHWNANGWTLYY